MKPTGKILFRQIYLKDTRNSLLVCHWHQLNVMTGPVNRQAGALRLERTVMGLDGSIMGTKHMKLMVRVTVAGLVPYLGSSQDRLSKNDLDLS